MTSLTKKLITALFAAVMAVCVTAGIFFAVDKSAFAEGETSITITLTDSGDSESSDFSYDENDANILTGLSAAGVQKVTASQVRLFIIELPATVTEIASGVSTPQGIFGEYTSKLAGIVIPSGSKLTKIGDYAFYGSAIVNLDLSNAASLSGIGKNAFCNSANMTSITIPESVTAIGNLAFGNCYSLTSVNYYATDANSGIINTFNSLASNPFYNAGREGSGITLTIGKTGGAPVSVIPGNMFYTASVGSALGSDGSNNLKNIVFANVADNVTFGANAFRGCSGLESVQFASNLTQIGASAFYGCMALSEITLPAALTSVGESAFRGTSLGTVSIPADVTQIGTSAFQDCTKLATVDYADGAKVTSIGSSAFKGCFALETINVPAKVTTIGNEAYSGCTAVTDIEFNATSFNSTLSSSSPFNGVGTNGFTLTVDGATKLSNSLFAKTNVTEVTLKNVNVAEADFGLAVFSGCAKLTKVNFDSNCVVPAIGGNAFESCTLLSDVTLPVNLEKIGAYAFRNCTSLESITIPSNAKTIAATSFTGCTRLFEVIDLTGTYSAGAAPFNYAFNVSQNGDSQLIKKDGFTFVLDSRTDTETKDKYLLIAYAGSATEVELPEGLLTDGSATAVEYVVYQNSFKDTAVTKITVPDKNVTLGSYAFAENKNLIEVVLPDSLQVIPQYLCNNCTSLTKINFPSKLTTIEDRAFYNTGLISVTLPESIVYTGTTVFGDCENLKTVYLPDYEEDKDIERNYSGDMCSGTEAVIIAANKSAYIIDKPDFVTVEGYTYVTELYLVYNDETHTEKVLYGLKYGYVYDEDTDAWSFSEIVEEGQEIMPVQEGYISSVWYENSDYSGTAVTAARLKELLSGSNNATLYARYMLPPVEEIEVSYASTKDGIALTVEGINGLIHTVYSIPEGVTLVFDSYVTANGETQSVETVESIKNVGTYKFVLSFDEASDGIQYGEWENAYLTIVVAPEPVDISTGGKDDTLFLWGYGINGTFTQFMPGNFQSTTLYIYNGTPYLVQQDDLGSNPKVQTVIDSYLLYVNRAYTVMLNDNPGFFTVESYTNRSGKDAGMYTTSAVIKLTGNYSILTDFDDDSDYAVRLRLLGIRVIPDSLDSTKFTIEKDWYIVASINDVLKDENTPYSITGWVYNNAREEDIPTAPVLRYNNNQADILITFSITLDGESIVNYAEYNDFSEFFNSSMPAGDYVLTLYIDACSYGDLFYPRSERQYTFTITRANLGQASLGADADKLIGKSFTYEWDGYYHYYDTDSITLSTLGSELLIAERKGAWTDDIYNKYFTSFEISYNLLRQKNNEYFKATDPDNEYLPIEPDTYTVYFQISAPNYVPLVDINSDNRFDYYFNVYIYRVLSEYEVTGGNYTGEIVRPIINNGPYLSVIWLDTDGLNSASDEDRTAVQNYFAGVGLPEEYISAGYHKFVLKILNTTYYQWDKSSEIVTFGPNDEYGIFTFQIYESENVITTHLNLIRWSWGSYDATQNFPIWATKFGSETDYTFTLTLTSDMNVQYKLTSLVNEFGNAIAGEYTLRAECVGGSGYGPLSEEITVNIMRATNYWQEIPNLERWVYGTFEQAYEAPTAVPTYGNAEDVVFYYYKADASHNAILTNKYDSIEDLLVDGEVPAGNYVLMCELKVNENSNYTGLSSQIKFTVMQAENYWDVTPNISGWVYGQYYDGLEPAAEPHFGIVDYFTYYVLDEEGEPVKTYYAISDMRDSNGQIPVGSYRVAAHVSAGDNYKEMIAATEFTVARLTNYWTETPNVVRWYYGDYDKGVNLIYAVPAFGTATFTIYVLGAFDFVPLEFTNDDGNTVASFTLDEDGLVPDYVAKALLTLDAGVYHLLARVEEDENYSGINNHSDEFNLEEATLTFNILKAQNYWLKIPTILGWIEGHYDETENAITSIAKYGDVIITITDRDGNVITTNADGATLDLKVLKNLSIGNYELNAFVAADENHTGLDSTTSFAVFEDSVGVRGIIAAFMVFAVIAVLLAAAAVVLLVLRRRKLEAEFRKMIHNELNRR